MNKLLSVLLPSYFEQGLWYVTLKVFSSFISKNFVYTRVEIILGKEVLGTSLAFALIKKAKKMLK